jgi:hypothetical protein
MWNHQNYLHIVGWELEMKLKGFPFAVKTIGWLLQNRLIVDHWKRSLENKDWEFHFW